MLADVDPIAFVHTTDVAAARTFYVDVLGLGFVEESPFALVLRSGRTMVRVTPVGTHAPAGATVLGWSVTDVAAVLGALVERGVRPLRFEGMEQDELGVWSAPGGARVAWFSDPDGNTLSLTQL